jgi:Cytidine and deoxycytidylate deaminase zinc-binding region
VGIERNETPWPRKGTAMASDPLGDAGFMRRAMALAREGDRKPGAAGLSWTARSSARAITRWISATIPPPTPRSSRCGARGEKLRQSEFRDATLYSTLQPCGMCTMASIWGDTVEKVWFEVIAAVWIGGGNHAG